MTLMELIEQQIAATDGGHPGSLMALGNANWRQARADLLELRRSIELERQLPKGVAAKRADLAKLHTDAAIARLMP